MRSMAHGPQAAAAPIGGSESAGMVYVVDDDDAMSGALSSLLRSAGFDVLTFAAPDAFLRHIGVRHTRDGHIGDDVPSCLLLDVRLHGESGFSLQDAIARSAIAIPIVFMTGHGDVEMSVRAMKAGAMDFFVKPFRDQDMLDAIVRALTTDRMDIEKRKALGQVRARYALLTPREREVIQHVVLGKLNKQIAASLCVSEITVKMHRGSAMRKLAVHSVAELVRLVDAVEAAATLAAPAAAGAMIGVNPFFEANVATYASWTSRNS